MFNDFRYALRRLLQNPGLTIAAVVTVALGIGVNTALFAVYDAIALKPLPVSRPDEVGRLKRWFQQNYQGDQQYFFSYGEYAYVREHNNVFSGIVAASRPTPLLTDAQKFQAQMVSANYFDVLGVAAETGRTFLADEDRLPGGNPVIVLSHGFWQRQFHGDAQAVGKTILVGRTPLTVVGVAPASFSGTSLNPVVPDFWVPASMQAVLMRDQDWLNDPSDQEFNVLARLKPGATLHSAQPQIDALIRQFAGTYPEREKTASVTLERTAMFGNVDDPGFQAVAIAAMAVVGLILLVACANVANMMLAHGMGRQREIAIRRALGAGRARIVRQLTSESILTALLAGVAGIFFAAWTVTALWGWLTTTLVANFIGDATVKLNLAPDIRVFAYAGLMAVAAVVLFGLVPALQITKPDLAGNLKDEGGFLGRSFRRSRLRNLFVGVQVAVSMLFLLIAGLLMRGLLRSQQADTGFETKTVYLISTDFGRDAVKAAALRQRVVERLRTLPEIAGVATGHAPLFGTWTPPIVIDGKTDRTLASFASDTYFDLLGIPILRGRGFTPQEARDGSHVAVVSEATARRFWPGQDVLSKHLKLDLAFRGELTEFEIVGIAKDVRFANPTRIDPAHVYLPTMPGRLNGILIRTQGNPEKALTAAQTALETISPALIPYLQWQNLERGPLALQRFFTRFFTGFLALLAVLALTLASVGIYGVVAYLVRQQTKEIGIRVALGASRGNLLRLIVLGGLRPVIIGALAGATIAFALSWLFHMSLRFPGASDFLGGVPFYDPVVFAGSSFLVSLIAALAAFVPAQRALRADPLAALRYE